MSTSTAAPAQAVPATLLPVRHADLGSRPDHVMTVNVALGGEFVYATHSYTPAADPTHPDGLGDLVVLDRATLTERHRFPVSVGPIRVEADRVSGRAVVLGHTAGLAGKVVTALDPVTGAVGWTAGFGFGLVDLAVAAGARRVYVLEAAGGALLELDADTGSSLRTFPIGRSPVAVAVDEVRQRAYVALNERVGTAFPLCSLVVLDLAAGVELPRIVLDQTNVVLQDLVVDVGRDLVHVVAQGNVGSTGPSVFTVAPATGAVGRVPLSSPGRVGSVDPASGRVYAAGENAVFAVDTAAGAVAESGPLTGLPGRSVVDPATGLLYVGESWTGRVVEYRSSVPPPVPAPDLALSSSGARINLFRQDPAGTVETAQWADDDDWTPFSPIGLALPPGAALTALGPTPTGWWLFGVDAAGVLWGVVGDGVVDQLRHQLGAGFVPGGHVAWASPFGGQVFVYAADATGTVRSYGFDATGVLSGPVLHEGITVAPGAPIAAVSRKPEHWDLFVLHPDGRVWTQWWSTDEDGFSAWGALGGPRFDPGTRISCAGRRDDQLDLFAVGPDGRAMTVFWNNEDGWRSWNRFADDALFPPGRPIAVTHHSPLNLTIFGVDLDGQLRTTFWDHDDGWGGWGTIGATGRTPGAAVCVSRRHPRELDVCWLAPDGEVGHAWWNRQLDDWSTEFGLVRPVGTPSTFHTADVHTDVPVKGDVRVNLWADGSSVVRGHMHGTGIAGYDFVVQATVPAPLAIGGFAAVETYRDGHVDGWNPIGSEDRDYDWIEFGPPDLGTEFLFPRIRGAPDRPLVLSHAVNATGVFGEVQNLIDDVIESHLGLDVVQALGGTLVLGLGIGRAMTDLLGVDLGDHGWLGFSVLTAANGLWLVLPASAVVLPLTTPLLDDPVFGAAARPMEPSEWAWASRVFGGSLPHPDLIWLTNLKSAKDSAFTSRDGDRFLVHLGSEAFDDPMGDVNDPGAAPGKTFIHELTHVWDAAHSGPAWEYPAIFAQFTLPEAVPDGTQEWTGLDTEEKAVAIADWYDRFHANLNSPAALADPLFPYVQRVRDGIN